MTALLAVLLTASPGIASIPVPRTVTIQYGCVDRPGHDEAIEYAAAILKDYSVSDILEMRRGFNRDVKIQYIVFKDEAKASRLYEELSEITNKCLSVRKIQK